MLRASWLWLSLLLFPGPFTVAAAADVEESTPFDAYQAMRDRCAGAGEESWVRCQRIAVTQSALVRRKCDENQDRARRVCMLRVMEQQNRDIHGDTP